MTYYSVIVARIKLSVSELPTSVSYLAAERDSHQRVDVVPHSNTILFAVKRTVDSC